MKQTLLSLLLALLPLATSANAMEASSTVNEEWLAMMLQTHKEAIEEYQKIDSLTNLKDWFDPHLKPLYEIKYNLFYLLERISSVEAKVYAGEATEKDVHDILDEWQSYLWSYKNYIFPFELNITSSGGGSVEIDLGYSDYCYAKVRNATQHFRYLYPKPFDVVFYNVKPDNLHAVDKVMVNGKEAESTSFSSYNLSGELVVTFRISDEVATEITDMRFQLARTLQFMLDEEARIAAGKEYEADSKKGLLSAFADMKKIINETSQQIDEYEQNLQDGNCEDWNSELQEQCGIIGEFPGSFQHYETKVTITASEGGEVRLDHSTIVNTTKTLSWLYGKAFTTLFYLGYYGYASGDGNVIVTPYDGYIIKSIHVDGVAQEILDPRSPWNYKGLDKNVVVEFEKEIAIEKCATPAIAYKDGKLKFTCETEGAVFVSEVTVADAKKYYDAEVPLLGVYHVTAYATKPGYDNSDIATADFVIKGSTVTLVGDVNNDGKVDATDITKLIDILLGR